MKVLVVAENVSKKMGGEASLPFYYAQLFLQRGVDVHIACHARVRDEVQQAFAGMAPDRLHFVEDTRFQLAVFKLASVLNYRLRSLVNGQIIHYSTQWRIRAIAKDLARREAIDVVYEPAPITPKGLSFMFGIGVPVVIGPMCGGMNYPPAFRHLDSLWTRVMVELGRWLSHAANHIIPGKLRADVLMVANRQTEDALPIGARGKTIQLFESGVDLDIWKEVARANAGPQDPVRFVYSGRFVDLKGIQFLIPAFRLAAKEDSRCVLELVGGGGEYEDEVNRLCADPAIRDRVVRHGWVTRERAAEILASADVFVMPSLKDCGGTVLLEAMALGLPIITTRWGGPSDYINDTCGILVAPDGETAFIDGLKDAILQLTRSAETRKRLGEGGRIRVKQEYFEWRAKADRVLEIIGGVVGPTRSDKGATPSAHRVTG